MGILERKKFDWEIISFGSTEALIIGTISSTMRTIILACNNYIVTPPKKSEQFERTRAETQWRDRQTDRGARWQTGVRLSHLLDGFAGGEVEAVIFLCFTVANDEQVVLIRQPLLGTAWWREGQKGEKERERAALEFSGGRVRARLSPQGIWAPTSLCYHTALLG